MNNPEIDEWCSQNEIFEKEIKEYLKLLYGTVNHLSFFVMHNNIIVDYPYQYEKEFWEGIMNFKDFSKINLHRDKYTINHVYSQPIFIGAKPDQILMALQKIHQMKAFL